jgi:hypothetical protein
LSIFAIGLLGGAPMSAFNVDTWRRRFDSDPSSTSSSLGLPVFFTGCYSKVAKVAWER